MESRLNNCYGWGILDSFWTLMSQVPRLAHLRRRQSQSPKTFLVPTIMNLDKEHHKHTFTVVSWLILSFLYLIKRGSGLSLTVDEAGIPLAF